MTAQLSRTVYRVGNPENDEHHFTDQKDHADIAKNNGYEVAEYVLAGMGTAVAGFDAATAIRACMEEFPEHVYDIVEECAQIAENTISNRHTAPPAPVTGVDDDVRNIIGLLETNEWAEHCTSTVLGSRLESEITRLVGEKQPAPVAVHDFDTLRLLFEASERESDHGFNLHKYGIGYADEATQARWEVWASCRAAMLKAGPVTAATVPELTNAQCLEFLAVAFRHANIKGDIEFDDIRLGLKMALSAAPEQEV